MQLVNIGTKNQIVIPLEVRRKVKAIKPGRKVAIYPIDENTIQVKVSPKNWVDYSYGAMKDIWSANPVGEIDKARDEW